MAPVEHNQSPTSFMPAIVMGGRVIIMQETIKLWMKSEIIMLYDEV